MTTKGFGYCGLACDYCQDNQECVGCKQGGCPEKETCIKVKIRLPKLLQISGYTLH